MAFLTETQLLDMGFKKLGKNVKISDKAAIYNCDRISIGDNTRIDDFCVISGTVTLGRNVHIAIFCNVAGGEPGVTMEDFSGLAYGCQIFAQSDDYTGKTLTNPTVPAAYKNEAKAAINIGRHVIVGTSSLVLPGVDLAEGCAVGAMSMVTKSTEQWGIYFGIPAKRIKNRSQKLLELEAAYLASEQ
ncbi:acyltransferase [Pseudomonas protegens]|uniref:acyltransferase n=1 Tax=Pseudomonas protegens TaxID=380021 RepID=UPI001576088A|nr:acyltransferase [Pseudomonas protegens]NTZ71459.1 acyltransferase [Pseudomonas protegens]